MKNHAQESSFTRLYLWAAAVKSTMGLFFSFFVFMYLLLGIIPIAPATQLDFFTSLEMMIAAFIIGILQYAFLPDGDKFTKFRSFLWICSSTAVTLVFSIVFGWFSGFPLWCPISFIALTAIGIGFMIHLYHLHLARETKRLNKKLEQFQNKQK